MTSEHPLVRVAVKQRQMIMTFLANICITAVMFAALFGGAGVAEANPEAAGLGILLVWGVGALVGLVLFIMMIIFSAQLMAAMGSSSGAIALTLLAFAVSAIIFPLLALIIIVVLSSRATTKLKNAGINVGFLGVNKANLAKVRALPPDATLETDPFAQEAS